MGSTEYKSNGNIRVDTDVLDLAFDGVRIRETMPEYEMDIDPMGFKSDYVSHLISLEGPNYDSEEGYSDLDAVDRLLLEGKELRGPENKVRQEVIERRDELREKGRERHASQLESVLIGKRGPKLSCKEVEGGQGLHPGNVNYQQNHKYGGPNKVRERDYSDHKFGLQSDSHEQAIENLSKVVEFLQ